MSEPTVYYANPDETTFTGACFTFRFGAYGDTVVHVIQRPDHVEDALETAAECLKSHEPGHFTGPEYQEVHDERQCTECTDGSCDECREAAEADLTYTEEGWLVSHEWTVDESSDEPFESPRFDRFDIVAAHFCYWNAYHCGQASDGYRDLCRAMALGENLTDKFDSLSDNGKAIYRKLVLTDGR